jgi:hypothetical protein
MGYVALSRIRSLDGVYLTGLNDVALQVHSEIAVFDQMLRAASSRFEAADVRRIRRTVMPKRRLVAPAIRRRPVRRKRSGRRHDRKLVESMGVVVAVAAWVLMLVL